MKTKKIDYCTLIPSIIFLLIGLLSFAQLLVTKDSSEVFFFLTMGVILTTFCVTAIVSVIWGKRGMMKLEKSIMYFFMAIILIILSMFIFYLIYNLFTYTEIWKS